MDPTPETPTPKPAAVKLTLRERFKTLIAESGAIVLWVYFGIFGLVLVGTATAIELGVKLEGAAGVAGTWGAAYLFTKLTQPLRIAATLAITPAIATFIRRFRKRAPAAEAVDTVEAADPAAPEPSVAGGQSQK